MRLLVVDDDRAVRHALRRALTLAGYEVKCAEGGAEAIELVAEELPEAVVLDVAMPEIDGLEVCRRLRLLGNRVPILLLTARVAASDRFPGLATGADECRATPLHL